jgi:hypothetical protein
MKKEGRADQVVPARDIAIDYIRLQKVDVGAPRHGQPRCFERHFAHVTPPEFDGEAAAPEPVGDIHQDVTAATRHVEDPDRTRPRPADREDLPIDPEACERHPIDPGERSKSLQVSGPIEIRIIHDLGLATPKGEIRVSHGERSRSFGRLR